jgi:cytochrome P450
LAKYPAVEKKLQHLLDEAMPRGLSDWTIDRLKTVTYLDDLISETLRLKPALLHGGSRETPAEGIQVDEVHIPGNTIVLVPTWKIQCDPRYWRDAEEFIPERWGERREEMQTDKSPYLPFLLGE